MHRIAFCVLVAASLAACDTGTPQASPPLALAAPAVLASSKADAETYVVTEALQIVAKGETVVLQIDGQSFELSTRDAYRLGEALSSAGYAQDPKLWDLIGPGGGDGPRCEPPPPGSYAQLFDGRVYAGGGGDKCPPPPPPPFYEFDLAQAFYGPGVEVIEVEEGAEWVETPAGFVGQF